MRENTRRTRKNARESKKIRKTTEIRPNSERTGENLEQFERNREKPMESNGIGERERESD